MALEPGSLIQKSALPCSHLPRKLCSHILLEQDNPAQLWLPPTKLLHTPLLKLTETLGLINFVHYLFTAVLKIIPTLKQTVLLPRNEQGCTSILKVELHNSDFCVFFESFPRGSSFLSASMRKYSVQKKHGEERVQFSFSQHIPEGSQGRVQQELKQIMQECCLLAHFPTHAQSTFLYSPRPRAQRWSHPHKPRITTTSHRQGQRPISSVQLIPRLPKMLLGCVKLTGEANQNIEHSLIFYN